MFIHHLFLWLYCLPVPRLLLMIFLAAAALVAAHRRFHRRWWWKAGLAAVLLLGICGIGYQTVLSREPGHFQTPVYLPFHSYLQVLRGGNPELLRSNLMNGLMFFPLGLCAALLADRWNCTGRKLLLICICACIFSCIIEFAQIRYGLGLGEVDDILHNTLGALLGALSAVLLPQLADRIRRLFSARR